MDEPTACGPRPCGTGCAAGVVVHGLLDYRGPAELLEPVRAALHWVKDPASGRSILEAGLVRQVRVEGDSLHVLLAVMPGPQLQVVAEDVRTELSDHLQGWRDICVRIQPRGLPSICSGVCRT